MKNYKLLQFTAVFILSLLLNVKAQSQSVIASDEFSYDGISELEIKGSFCYVEVKAGESNKVSFKGEIRGNAKDNVYKIMHDKSGSSLKVWLERPRNQLGRIEGELLFTVPKNINLQVNNSSGKVYVQGIESTNLDLRASSGRVEAFNINADSEIETSSGGIMIKDLSGSLNVKSSSGSQTLENIDANTFAVASSGGIRIRQLKGNLNARSSSGGIKAEGVTGDVEAVNSSGGIRLLDVQGRLKLKTTSGSIKGESVKLSGNSYFETSSGKTELQLENDYEDLSFDLRASSGGLYAGESRSNKMLLIKKGNIMIKGISTSGSQVYK